MFGIHIIQGDILFANSKVIWKWSIVSLQKVLNSVGIRPGSG
uniref:ORF41o n=1 Tax=Pinus koraiensis TaxID=88728 RepID=A4QMG6_PINKO|nr:ORF41o [Pinus koraiensis]